MSYLVAAYMLLWIIVFGYLVRLGLRQRELGRQVEALQRALEAKQARKQNGA